MAARKTLWRRGRSIAGWLAPSATLALMPKCPMCFAAYIALMSGVSIPVSTATYIRGSLLALCIGSLTFIGLRRIRRLPGR
jgi:hypothetical protein